jgi:heat shock protein HslJ
MKGITYTLAFIWIIACSPKSFPDSNWEGKKWVLIELNGNPVQVSGTDKDAHIQFDSDSKQISGNGGCNRIFGPYEIEKNEQLRFGNFGSTMMACPDSRFENAFLEAIRSVRSYAYEEGKLILKNDAGTEIIRLQ